MSLHHKCDRCGATEAVATIDNGHARRPKTWHAVTLPNPGAGEGILRHVDLCLSCVHQLTAWVAEPPPRAAR